MMQHFAFVEIANTSENLLLCITSIEDGKIKIVHLDARTPPFTHGPERVISDFCYDLRDRGIKEVGAHRHTSAWARENFTRRGIAYLRFDRDRPDIFGHFFALVDAGDVVLPKNDELVRQMNAARRLRGGHDDVFSVVAGACVRARAGMIGARTLSNNSKPEPENYHAA
jgi:hypothetical protein